MSNILKSDIAHPQYFNLLLKMYGESTATQKYICDSKLGLDTILANKDISTVFFHLLDSNSLIGHVGLIRTSEDIAYFGFFELTDTNSFLDLWQALLVEARHIGVKMIFGPVNGTIWHPYRVISETTSDPFFAHEPLSSIGYYNLFKSILPANIIEYHSAYRTNFEMILEQTKSSLNKENLKVVQVESSTELLKVIYDLSVSIFSPNPGYYSLTFTDFAKLYSDSEKDKSKRLIYLVFHKKKPIGFSYNLIVENVLIMKTIGILPEWQEKGIGNTLVHEVHKFAQDKNMLKVIYALIRTDNRVKHFPKDDVVIFRKYAAFNYFIS